MSQTKFTQDQVIRSLQTCKGLVTIAARQLKCSPTTIRSYAAKYPAVAAALKEEREGMADVAELALYNAMQQGEAWAICFYLKTQGKDRGYVERQEHSSPSNQPLRLVVEYSDPQAGEPA